MHTKSVIAGLIIGALIGFALAKLLHRNDAAISQQQEKTAWPWPGSLDAVKAAPNSHKILYEDDRVRILEVTVDPYGFEPLHTHQFPSVMFGSAYDTAQFNIIYYRYGYDPAKKMYVALDSIPQHSGGKTEGPNEGNYMKPEGPHRIKNLSNVRIDAFRVEFKTK